MLYADQSISFESTAASGYCCPYSAQGQSSIHAAPMHTEIQRPHPHTTNRVVNKITTGIVTSASMVDTATLAVTSSCATS